MLRLDGRRVGAVGGADGLDSACGINGVLGKLPLPRADAPRPLEAPALQLLPNRLVGNIVKENLKAVRLAVGDNLAALKLPSDKTDLAGLLQTPQTGFEAVYLWVVVGQRIS